jgi:serine/threonine protein kinase
MSLFLSLSSLALRQVVDGACAALGVKDSGEAVVGFLTERFTDHSQRLTRALQAANDNAWKALEIALAGDSLWEKCKGLAARAEDRAFARQVRAFLDATPLPELAGKATFRQKCLEELRAARKDQALAAGSLDPRQLAQGTADLARLSDPTSRLVAERRVLVRVANRLNRAGYKSLAWLLGQRHAEGSPLLVVAVRHFFRRAVEDDQKLFQGLSFAKPMNTNTRSDSKDAWHTAPAGCAPAEMPQQFGRYRIKKKLGGGGMGRVYLVANTELQREEALKVPHFESGGDPTLRERFLREARAAARLDHPNLCPVYDVGELGGVCYLTMRYLQGKPLSDYAGHALPPRKAVEIVLKLALALEYAHSKGVIHRDLKPSNVMLCPGTGPVILDFGLAKQTLQLDEKLTRTGTVLGTPRYMPPEQARGELDRMGPASDVYSVGVILFELLTGRVPFEGPPAVVLANLLCSATPLPSHLQPGLPAALDAICAKALAKEPEQRFASTKAFAAALLEVLRTIPAKDSAANPPTATVEIAETIPPTTRSRPGKRPPPIISPRQPRSKPSGASVRTAIGGLAVPVVLLGGLTALLFTLPRYDNVARPTTTGSASKPK